MKATKYEINTCFMGNGDYIHAIFINKNKGIFIPLYLNGELDGNLLRHFSGDETEEDKYMIMFIHDSWKKLGFEVKSIVIDHQGKEALLPTITFLQNQNDERFIYITTFVPINTALLMSSCFEYPLYFTDRSEVVLKKMALKYLNKYIKDSAIGKEESNEP